MTTDLNRVEIQVARLEERLHSVEDSVERVGDQVNELAKTITQEKLELAKYTAKLGVLWGIGGGIVIALLKAFVEKLF